MPMEPNTIMTFVAEWGILLISMLLVFSPFIYLGYRKWKKHLSVNWWQVIGAYISSFAIYYVWEWVILLKLDTFLLNNGSLNAQWLRDALYNPSFKMIFIVGLCWPALVFYVSALIKKRPYNIWHFIISLTLSVSMLYLLFKLALFLMAVGLGYVGANYF